MAAEDARSIPVRGNLDLVGRAVRKAAGDRVRGSRGHLAWEQAERQRHGGCDEREPWPGLPEAQASRPLVCRPGF